MSTSVSLEVSLEKKLQQLEEQLKAGAPDAEQFRQAHQKLRELRRRFQELLQWAAEQHRNENELKSLYRQVAGWNASDLVESLKRTGFAFRQDRDLKDAFDRQGYRILELVRSGKRDDAFHAILRIFVSAKKEFPAHLVEALKPIYSDELFKVFLFSFLSGILGKEQEIEQ